MDCSLAETGDSLIAIAIITGLVIVLALALLWRKNIKKLFIVGLALVLVLQPLSGVAYAALSPADCDPPASSQPPANGSPSPNQPGPGTPPPVQPDRPVPPSVPLPGSTVRNLYNYIYNPRAASAINGPTYNARGGATGGFRTNSLVGWANRATTDYAITSAGSIEYMDYQRFARVPAGNHTLSLQTSFARATTVTVVYEWYQGSTRVGPVTTRTFPVEAGVNTITMDAVRPDDSRIEHLRIRVTPADAPTAAEPFAISNLYFGESSTPFNGFTQDTATEDYRWSGNADRSWSVAVVSPVAAPAITSSDFSDSATPTITGTATPGTTVTVQIEGYGFTVPVAPDGSWRLDVPFKLADNQAHHVIAVATNDQNQTSRQTIQELRVQTSGRAGGQFFTLGSKIYGPDGKEYVPVGANVGMKHTYNLYGYRPHDNKGVANGNSDAVLAWGWNTIRLNLKTITMQDTTYRSREGFDAMVADVDSIIAEYSAKKVVIMMDAHDLFYDLEKKGVNWEYFPQIEEFWHYIADKHKNNPYVWFSLGNEPPYVDQQWVDVFKHLIDIVRGKGARNMIVLDRPSIRGNERYMWDASMGPEMVDYANGNIVLDHHEYSDYKTAYSLSNMIDQVHDAGVPILIGEFGYTTDGSSTAGDYASNVASANAVFEVAPVKKVGTFWWNSTFGPDRYSLTANNTAFFNVTTRDTAALSPAGLRYWDLTH